MKKEFDYFLWYIFGYSPHNVHIIFYKLNGLFTPVALGILRVVFVYFTKENNQTSYYSSFIDNVKETCTISVTSC